MEKIFLYEQQGMFNVDFTIMNKFIPFGLLYFSIFFSRVYFRNLLIYIYIYIYIYERERERERERECV